jgi:parallel beta-helix repeat protein
VVRDSAVNRISSYAIEVLGTAQLLRNTISESGGGISVSDGGQPTAPSVVSGNTVALSEPSTNNSGISVWTSFGANVTRNSVSGSYLYGIRLRLSAGQALVGRNTVTDNAGHGIWLEVAGANLLVERNTALRNGADGLNLSGPNTTVTRNRANRNGELGINAAGVIDGGGNRARGNGNLVQCVGVRCK